MYVCILRGVAKSCLKINVMHTIIDYFQARSGNRSREENQMHFFDWSKQSCPGRQRRCDPLSMGCLPLSGKTTCVRFENICTCAVYCADRARRKNINAKRPLTTEASTPPPPSGGGGGGAEGGWICYCQPLAIMRKMKLMKMSQR